VKEFNFDVYLLIMKMIMSINIASNFLENKNEIKRLDNVLHNVTLLYMMYMKPKSDA
jgi:hypothetical protein